MFMKTCPIVSALVMFGAFLPLTASDDNIRAEIQPVFVASTDLGDPDVVAFIVRFDLRLTNGSAEPIELPKPGSDRNVTREFVLAIQSQAPDGSWKNVIQSSFYDTGTLKYDSCVSVPPSAGQQFTGLESRLTLLRKQLTDLGTHPIIRFNVMTFCKQQNGTSEVSLRGGNVASKVVMTEPFSIRLPQPK
jgi:hypothetical protein